MHYLKQAVKKLNKFCAVNKRVKTMPADRVLCGENEADNIKEHFWKQRFVLQKRLCKRKPHQFARFWELWKTFQKNKVLQHCANTKHHFFFRPPMELANLQMSPNRLSVTSTRLRSWVKYLEICCGFPNEHIICSVQQCYPSQFEGLSSWLN